MSTPDTEAANERHALRWLATVLALGASLIIGAGSGLYHLLT